MKRNSITSYYPQFLILNVFLFFFLTSTALAEIVVPHIPYYKAGIKPGVYVYKENAPPNFFPVTVTDSLGVQHTITATRMLNHLRADKNGSWSSPAATGFYSFDLIQAGSLPSGNGTITINGETQNFGITSDNGRAIARAFAYDHERYRTNSSHNALANGNLPGATTGNNASDCCKNTSTDQYIPVPNLPPRDGTSGTTMSVSGQNFTAWLDQNNSASIEGSIVIDDGANRFYGQNLDGRLAYQLLQMPEDFFEEEATILNNKDFIYNTLFNLQRVVIAYKAINSAGTEESAPFVAQYNNGSFTNDIPGGTSDISSNFATDGCHRQQDIETAYSSFMSLAASSNPQDWAHLAALKSRLDKGINRCDIGYNSGGAFNSYTSERFKIDLWTIKTFLAKLDSSRVVLSSNPNIAPVIGQVPDNTAVITQLQSYVDDIKNNLQYQLNLNDATSGQVYGHFGRSMALINKSYYPRYGLLEALGQLLEFCNTHVAQQPALLPIQQSLIEILTKHAYGFLIQTTPFYNESNTPYGAAGTIYYGPYANPWFTYGAFYTNGATSINGGGLSILNGNTQVTGRLISPDGDSGLHKSGMHTANASAFMVIAKALQPHDPVAASAFKQNAYRLFYGAWGAYPATTNGSGLGKRTIRVSNTLANLLIHPDAPEINMWSLYNQSAIEQNADWLEVPNGLGQVNAGDGTYYPNYINFDAKESGGYKSGERTQGVTMDMTKAALLFYENDANSILIPISQTFPVTITTDGINYPAGPPNDPTMITIFEDHHATISVDNPTYNYTCLYGIASATSTNILGVNFHTDFSKPTTPILNLIQGTPSTYSVAYVGPTDPGYDTIVECVEYMVGANGQVTHWVYAGQFTINHEN